MPASSHSGLYPSNAYCTSFSLSNCPSFKQYGHRLDLQFQPNHTYRKYKETSHMFCSNSLISGNLSCLVPFHKEGTWGIWNKHTVLFFLMLCSWFFHSPTEGVCLFLFPLRESVWVLYIWLFQIFLIFGYFIRLVMYDLQT
jgi:hypothetical protein